MPIADPTEDDHSYMETPSKQSEREQVDKPRLSNILRTSLMENQDEASAGMKIIISSDSKSNLNESLHHASGVSFKPFRQI